MLTGDKLETARNIGKTDISGKFLFTDSVLVPKTLSLVVVSVLYQVELRRCLHDNTVK